MGERALFIKEERLRGEGPVKARARISRALSGSLIALLLASTTTAQAEISTVKSDIPTKASNQLSYSVTAGVSSNVYELNSRDFSASSSLRAGIGYQVNNTYAVNVGLGLSQGLSGATETKVSNSTVTVSHKAIQLNPDLSLALAGTAVLPTNESARKQLSFLGAAVASATLLQPFDLMGKGMKASYGLSATRNLHEFKRTAADTSNIMHSAKLSAGLSGGINDKLSFNLSSSVTGFETYQNTLSNYLGFSQSISYKITKKSSVTVGHSSEADLLDSDGQGQNIQLFGEDSSSFFGSLTVSL